MLILKAISLSLLHGYGILLRIQQISKERLEIRGRCIPPFIVWSITDGSRASGENRTTTGVLRISACRLGRNTACNPRQNAGTR
jgi:hypothetical protein